MDSVCNNQQLDHDLDEVMAAAIASSSTITVANPIITDDGVTESYPQLAPIWTLIYWTSTERSCIRPLSEATPHLKGGGCKCCGHLLVYISIYMH
jgi:hypothetical protein